MSTLRDVRHQLADRRAAGEVFDDAWAAVVGALGARERECWIAALEETRDAWRAAFEHRPATIAERAFTTIASDPERVEQDDTADPWERICAHCEGRIPDWKRPTARYCGEVCQRAANGRRITGEERRPEPVAA